jgi:hypothetical protein
VNSRQIIIYVTHFFLNSLPLPTLQVYLNRYKALQTLIYTRIYTVDKDERNRIRNKTCELRVIFAAVKRLLNGIVQGKLQDNSLKRQN